MPQSQAADPAGRSHLRGMNRVEPELISRRPSARIAASTLEKSSPATRKKKPAAFAAGDG